MDDIKRDLEKWIEGKKNMHIFSHLVPKRVIKTTEKAEWNFRNRDGGELLACTLKVIWSIENKTAFIVLLPEESLRHINLQR